MLETAWPLRRRRLHSRTRAGCNTCRRRRVKCDENKPTCGGCEKGSRECIYRETVDKPSKKEITPSSHCAASSSQEFVTAEEVIEFSRSEFTTVVRFPSPPIPSRPSSNPCDNQLNVLKANTYPAIYTPLSPNELVLSPPPEFTPSPYISPSPSILLHAKPFNIPKSLSPQLQSARSPPIQFFLKFHRERITEAHYFRWYDYPKLCTIILFSLAETSDSLRHAMVAFSALIYSYKFHQGARQVGLFYYEKALQDLRLFLNTSPMEIGECLTAVATALQLSSFDRFYGDSTKCFRHLKGVASVLQKRTTPTELCSTVIGRSLLEWHIQLEDYCCFLTGSKLLLPRIWRNENVRIRQIIADQEYPRLSPKNRIPRILADVFSQSVAMFPNLWDILNKVPSLIKLDTEECYKVAAHLEEQLQQHIDDVEQFLCQPHVVEVLQPADPSSPHQYKHESCCPLPPFTPHRMQFPPAGIFRMVTFATQWYIRSIFYPAIRAKRNPAESTGLTGKTAIYYSHEICRTFAGIEDELQRDDPDALMPVFSLLMMATTTCSPELRVWLWYKLRHFEHLGYLSFEAIKKHLATLWNIPEIVTKGFSHPPPLSIVKDLSCDDIIAATREIRSDDSE